MGLVTRSISIAANVTDPNILNTLGLRVRTVAADAGAVEITLFSTGSATGLEHAFFVSADNPMEQSIVNIRNAVPIIPDDLVIADVPAGPGEQVQLLVENTTVGALTYFFTLEINPV